MLCIPEPTAFGERDTACTFWLLDIDQTDSFLEILTYSDMNYDLWYYDRENELLSAGHMICGWYDTSVGYDKATDVRKPTRIDEQTISFHDWHFVFDSYCMTAAYKLNAMHQLEILQGEYELDFPHPIAFIGEEKELKLYAEPNLAGASVSVCGPSVYMLTKSDGIGWVYLENVYGESGWINIGEDDKGNTVIDGNLTREDFIGYSNVP